MQQQLLPLLVLPHCNKMRPYIQSTQHCMFGQSVGAHSPAVFCQDLDKAQQRLCKGLNTQLGPALCLQQQEKRENRHMRLEQRTLHERQQASWCLGHTCLVPLGKHWP